MSIPHIDGAPARIAAPPPPPPPPPPRQLEVRHGDEANGSTSTIKDGVSVTDHSVTVSGDQTDTTTRTDAAGTSAPSSTSSNASVGVDTEKGTPCASADVSVSLNVGVDINQAGLEVGRTEGIKGAFEVSMPEQIARSTNLAEVNPFDPDSMPTSTVIKLDASRYSGNEFKATFRNIGTETNINHFEGTGLLVEKTGTDQVRVTAGPSEAIEAYNGLGVEFSVAGVMLGRNDKLDGATLKTAEFNLASADGRAAYNDFVATGTMPTANGQGVAEVATIQKLDFSSQTTLKAELGRLNSAWMARRTLAIAS